MMHIFAASSLYQAIQTLHAGVKKKRVIFDSYSRSSPEYKYSPVPNQTPTEEVNEKT